MVDDPAVAGALESNDSSRPFLVSPLPDAGVLHRHVVAPIVLDDELWGRLAVMEHKTRFAGGDVLTVRRAATLIALQMRTERSAVEADWNAGASLAAELLDGCSDATVAERRADRLGREARRPAPGGADRLALRSLRRGERLPRRRRRVPGALAGAHRPRHEGRRRGGGAGRAARGGGRADLHRVGEGAPDGGLRAPRRSPTGSPPPSRRCARSRAPTRSCTSRRSRWSSASGASRASAGRQRWRPPTWARAGCSSPPPRRGGEDLRRRNRRRAGPRCLEERPADDAVFLLRQHGQHPSLRAASSTSTRTRSATGSRASRS